MFPWLVAALIPAVQAADPSALDRAWYLAESSRVERALAATAQVLQEDPTDTAAHRLYAWLQVKGLRDAAGAEALYREWLEQEPGSDSARIVLANQLRWRSRHPGAWCAEAESLLVQPPTTLEDNYWAQRTLYELRKLCPGDQEAPRHAIMKLGEQVPEARAYALRLQLEEQPVDAGLARALEALFEEQPWRLTYAGNPWMMRGPAVEQAREAALAAADSALASEDPLLVESARRLFRYAGEQERLLEAEERLRVLDPGWEPSQFQLKDGAQWVRRTDDDELTALIRAATRAQRPRQAIAAARAFEDQLPETGPVRARYHALLAELHEHANQPVKALDAARLAWLADPDDPYQANDFAYRAATAGLHLEQALEAARGAVEALPGYDPRGDHPAQHYDDWLVHSRDHAAAFADTHGWVLYRLERYDQAAAALRHALLLASEPQAAHHLHLGLCYDRLDDTQGALRHLGRGLALADGSEPDLERAAYRRVVDLYQEQRWAPGGLEAWIALQAPPAAPVPEIAEDGAPPAGEGSFLGQRFPDLSYDQGGQQHTLSEIEGVRVVDLWATWCGPCVQALPELNKLAKVYSAQGVTFVALSVDAAPEDMQAHLAEDRPEHLVMGWAGRRALREARVTGIPKTFVIDGEGVIRAVHSGWDMSRGGDKNSRANIAESIDAVLVEQGEGAKE